MSKNDKRENGYILGLVMIFFVVFSIMGLAFIKMAGHERLHSFNYYNRVKAYHHASAGIYKSLWLLNKVSAAAGSFSDATVTVVYDSENLEIVATGKSGNIEKTIKVTLEYFGEYWPYVLYTDSGNLEFEGGEGTITGDIHSNTKVDISNYHTIDGSTTEGTPTVTVPGVDWAFFEDAAKAVGQYVTTKDKTFDSAGNPYTGVWYSTGKVKIEANTVINGTIVSEKDVQFKGDSLTITATPSDYPAIISGGNIKTKITNANVKGFVYSQNEFQAEGDDLTFIGAIVSVSKIKGGKSPSGINKVFTYDTTYTKNLSGINVSDWSYILYTDTDVIDFQGGEGTLTGDIHSNVEVIISNNHTINGTVTESPYVAPPVVDWLFFENAAKAVSQYVTTKDKTFDSAGSPYTGVWYATGKVKIEANTVINGTVVSEEDVEFKGDNLTITATPSTYPAILSKNNVKAKITNALVKGFVYCDAEFKPEGDDLTFLGAIVAVKKATSNNAPSGIDKVITYDSTYVSNIQGIHLHLSNGPLLRILMWEEL